MRIMVVAILMVMAAVVILALGETFNIWAYSGLLNIAVILVFVIPLSMMCFVILAHREQGPAKNQKEEDGSPEAP